MKILVATSKGQGKRKNDFNFCNEGEIVTFSFECDGEDIDGSCGCRRSLSGTTTRKSTTTMKVIKSSMTKEDVANTIYDSLEKGGWINMMSKEWGIKTASKDTEELLKIASTFKVGDVVEKRGNKFQKRI
jgi:hypothetical protein